jgi:hypothetical protein
VSDELVMYHLDWWASAFLLLFGAWVLYVVVRPVRDYYVLHRVYFDRQYKEPRRGEVPGRGAQTYVYYHGFDNYLAAKAVFDLHESPEYMRVLDTASQEAEHSLFMVPARDKAAAIARLKSGVRSKELLHKTPYADVLRRRKAASEAVQSAREADRDPKQVENAARGAVRTH